MATLHKAFNNALVSSLCHSLPPAVAERFTHITPTEFEAFLREWFQATRATEKKDPNLPKRNKSAYLFFCEATRPVVTKKHPEMKMTDVSKEMGKMWSNMSEGEKRTYEKMAEADKVRYERELAAYKETHKN